MKISGKNWKPYLTRHFSILGASLWQEWYKSDFLYNFLKVRLPDVLFIEDQKNVVRSYRPKEQQKKYESMIKSKIIKNTKSLLSLFKQAHQLNLLAKQYIKQGIKSFQKLEDANYFLIKLALCGTAIPYRVIKTLEDEGLINKPLIREIEKLRTISYYPVFIREVIEPIARRAVGKFYAKKVNLLTYQEIISGNFKNSVRRALKRKQNFKFVYQSLNGKEKIFWVKNTEKLITKIEGLKFVKTDNLKGQVGFGGLVRGRVKLVLSDESKNVDFKKGDILVTLTSSPTLMPLIVKAAAIITDDGGIGCHAAIISREMKKPCVIGTKIATKVFKDGDLVEVDANKGIIRKIK
jgi:pyruvate, water dikinase